MTFCSLERVIMILVEDLTIVSQREIAPRIFEMVLKGEMVADMKVGQFVHLKVPDPSKLLRRPISISEIDYDKKEATIVYRVERATPAFLYLHTRIHILRNWYSYLRNAVLAGFSACSGSRKRHYSSSPQCDPRGAFFNG